MNAKTQATLQQAAIEMQKYHGEMTLTLDPLMEDMNFALSHLRNDRKNQQFWRRAILRCILAYIEALIWNTKSGIPIVAAATNIQLTGDDLQIIREEKIQIVNGLEKRRPNYLSFRENLKSTFKLFAKVHGVAHAPNFDDGFEELCKTYDLRSRLMHPKRPCDLDVSNEAIICSRNGMNWFQAEYLHLLEVCFEASSKLV